MKNIKETSKYTPESVWQFIQELGEKIKMDSEEFKEQMKELRESQKETDRIIKESQQETDRQMKESRKEIDKELKEAARLVKENAKEIGGISKSNGEMAHEAIFNILKQDLTFAGIKFDDAIPKVPVLNGFKTETDIDALMLNGDTIALIEIKYKVNKKDVKKLVFDTVSKFKENFPKYDKYKILLGVGGMSFDDDAIDEAKENGVGVIKVVGDKVEYYTEGIKVY